MTTTITPPAALIRMSTSDLLDLFETTADQPMTEDLATVRGWIMDLIAARAPGAYDRWLESDDPDDATLRSYVL